MQHKEISQWKVKQLLKKLVTSTFGKDFYLGKIKFASTEQDCPDSYHLTYMKVKCKLLFNNLMSVLGLIKFWLVCKDENECSKGIQSKSYSVLLKYFPGQKCLLSFNFSKFCHSLVSSSDHIQFCLDQISVQISLYGPLHNNLIKYVILIL